MWKANKLDIVELNTKFTDFWEVKSMVKYVLTKDLYLPIGYDRENKCIIYDEGFADNHCFTTDKWSIFFAKNWYYLYGYGEKPYLEMYDYNHKFLGDIDIINANGVRFNHGLLYITNVAESRLYYGNKFITTLTEGFPDIYNIDQYLIYNRVYLHKQLKFNNITTFDVYDI